MISRFYTKNLLQCDTLHLQSISNRTLRAYTGSFTLVKIFIWGVRSLSAFYLTRGGWFYGVDDGKAGGVGGVSVALARLLVAVGGLLVKIRWRTQ